MASPFSLSCLLAEMALCWYCVRLLIHMPTLSAPWEGKGAAFFSQEILSAIWSDLILWATCNADRKGQNLLQVLFFTELRKSFLLDPWDSRVKRYISWIRCWAIRRPGQLWSRTLGWRAEVPWIDYSTPYIRLQQGHDIVRSESSFIDNLRCRSPQHVFHISHEHGTSGLKCKTWPDHCSSQLFEAHCLYFWSNWEPEVQPWVCIFFSVTMIALHGKRVVIRLKLNCT